MAPTPSYARGKSDAELLYAPIGQVLSEVAARYPDNDALVDCAQGRRFTYREFDALTSRLAKGLMAMGLGVGARVGIWGVNCWEWVAVQFATAKAGTILVNVNPAYRTHELEYALRQSEMQAIVLMESFKASRYLEMLQEVTPELATAQPGELRSSRLPMLRNVVVIGGRAPGTRSFDELLDLGVGVSDEDLAERMAGLDPDDEINIQYTSGTTGFPKGVVLTHFNVMNNGFHVGQVMRFTEKDRLCIPVPFYHCFGMVLSNLACVSAGATMVIPGPVFEPKAVFEAVQGERCTALHGVPTMFIAELNHPDFASYDLSTLRTGIMAGAPCPVETMKQVIERMHLRDVTIAYGMTESSPVATMTRLDAPLQRRVATVGEVMPWQEIKVVEPATGRAVPRGEQGEICFRGYHVMSRYYNNPEATAEAVDRAGWLHSGDLGVMDAEGFVKITGRIKEMVIRGGENLYPREIEEFLRTSGEMLDVYVVGVPDLKYGEELMAWVVLRPGSEATEESLREFCRGRITHHKVPRYWKFLRSSEELPMTVTGKIQKFKMRKIAIEELGLQDAAGVVTA